MSSIIHNNNMFATHPKMLALQALHKDQLKNLAKIYNIKNSQNRIDLRFGELKLRAILSAKLVAVLERQSRQLTQGVEFKPFPANQKYSIKFDVEKWNIPEPDAPIDLLYKTIKTLLQNIYRLKAAEILASTTSTYDKTIVMVTVEVEEELEVERGRYIYVKQRKNGTPSHFNLKSLVNKLVKIYTKAYQSSVKLTKIFFTQFKSATPTAELQFTLWAEDAALTNLNCVIKILQEKITKGKNKNDKEKTIAALLKYAEDKNIGNNIENSMPIKKADIIEFTKRPFRIKVVVKNLLGGIIFDPAPTNKHLTLVEILAHENHASIFLPIAEYSSKVSYVDDVEKKIAELKEQRVGFELVLDNLANKILAAKVGDTVFKKQIEGMDADDVDNKEYFNSYDYASYSFKKWKLRNNLRSISGVYYDICKEADDHLTVQKFKDYEYGDKAYSYDMNKAFPSFKMNPLYKKFGFMVGHMSLYKISNPEWFNGDKLNFTGCVRVSEIEYIGKEGEFIRDTKHILCDHWYSTIRLYNAVSEGYIKIKASHVMTSVKEDLEFPFQNTPAGKFYNNQFIGRVISGGKNSTFTRTFIINDEAERNYLAGQLSQEKDNNGNNLIPIIDGNKIEVSMTMSPHRRHQHQIHACILDYQQTIFINKMIECLDFGIITYNTDGFFTEREVPDIIIQPTKENGGFKSEGLKPIKWKCDFNRVIPDYNNFDLPDCPEYDFSEAVKIKLITGAAGSGKSYNYIEKSPPVDCSFGFPTNKLVASCMEKKPKTRKCIPAVPIYGDIYDRDFDDDIQIFATQNEITDNSVISTIHKLFDLNNTGKPQPITENVVVDEVSMIPKEYFTKIKSWCEKRRTNLILIGDINAETGKSEQRGCVGTIIGNMKENCGESFSHIAYDDNKTPAEFRRQPNPEHWNFIQSLRKQTALCQYKMLVDSPLIEKITEDEMLESWDENTIGIASKHININRFNLKIQEQHKFEKCRAKSVKTKKDSKGKYTDINGNLSFQQIENVWFGKMKSGEKSKKHYEAAYFITSDMIQGDSLTEKIVIDAEDQLSGFLYTAVSRCRDLSQIRLLKNKKLDDAIAEALENNEHDEYETEEWDGEYED